jgi:hypothetical protein
MLAMDANRAIESESAVARFAVEARHDRTQRMGSAWLHDLEGAPLTLEMRLQMIRRKRMASQLTVATWFAIWIAGLSALMVIAGAGILSIH